MKKLIPLTLGLTLAGSAMSLQADSSKFSPTHQKDVSSFAPETLEIQKRFSQNGSLESLVPEKMAAGQNGYLILTTNVVRDGSKVLKDFIKHKEALGFKVHLATEDQFGLTSEGKGRKQADKVRAWLQGQYKELNLLYVLIIDDPHPDKGVIPMAKFTPKRYKVYPPEQKKFYKKYLEYKDNPRTEDGKYLLWDGHAPSDYYYADLDSDWDANGNTILADRDDYKTGKINCVADVWVGRLPYMGEESEYGKMADLDILLQRTIDYENDTSDQSWKDNLFYVGGADPRWNKMKSFFMSYNGGEIESYRTKSGSGFAPTAEKWHGGRIADELNQDRAYGFINFQEHGSWAGMAGQINNKAAAQLKRTKPAYIYLGGCDVNSPEHPTNVTYALFRHAGIGAMGATRSVTSITGDKDTEAIAGYARLFFGQSQGEAHWRMLSDYADGMGRVGGSNFLMNLWGDPSVVVMPRTTRSSVILSPNMKLLKFRHQHRSKLPAGYTFNVRNTTTKPQKYMVKYSKNLKPEIKSFTLKPNETKLLPINFAEGHKLPVGKNLAKFEVKASDGSSQVRNIEMDVYGRNALFNHSFSTLADRKIVMYAAKGPSLEKVIKITNDLKDTDYVTMPKGYRADLRATKVAIGDNSCTIVARVRFEEAANDKKFQIFQFGKFESDFFMEMIGGQLVTTMGARGVNESDPGVKAAINSPKLEPGKWHQIIAIADREKQEFRLLINGEEFKTPFVTKPGQAILFDRIRFAYNRNQQDLKIDELSIFDYVLNPSEINTAVANKIIKQKFPKNADFANPNGVNLSWSYSQKDDTKFVIALADNPSFKGVKFYKSDEPTKVISDLEDKKTYYWRVGTMEDGKVSFPWKYFSSFTTDSNLKDYPIKITQNPRIRPATANDNAFTLNLNRYAKGTGKLKPNGSPDKVELFFAKVSGDNWLRCHPDGNLTTNHGAPAAGNYEFEFSVSTRYGQPKKFKITIPVK